MPHFDKFQFKKKKTRAVMIKLSPKLTDEYDLSLFIIGFYVLKSNVLVGYSSCSKNLNYKKIECWDT